MALPVPPLSSRLLEPGRVPVTSDKRNAVFGGCREPPRGHYLSTDIASSNGAPEVNTPAVCFFLHINFSCCVLTLLKGLFLVVRGHLDTEALTEQRNDVFAFT